MNKCQWYELPDESLSGNFELCTNAATHSSCDGRVCEQHKCRCSKTLEYPGPDNPAIELGTE